MNVIQRLRSHQELRSQRRRALGLLGQHLLPQLLPALRDTPLPVVDASGAPTTLEAQLRRSEFLTLSGPLGSGRGLALWQQAQRWAENDAAPLPALLALPQIDDGIIPPDQLLTERLDLSRSARSAPDPEGDPGLALLIGGWEDLDPDRRSAWRAALLRWPQRWPDRPLIVALPSEEPAWPGFTALHMRLPDDAVLATWLELLAAPALHTRLRSALAAGGPLATLRERLFELALLLWVAGRGRMPAHRAQLYDQALREVLADHPEAHLSMAQLQHLAAYDEAPAGALPGLIAPAPGKRLVFSHPLLRSYLAARQLADEGRFGLLRSLDLPQRIEVARFAAAGLDDPAPLYHALWGSGQTADDLLTLGHCLRERPSRNITWNLRLIGALALLGRDNRRPEALALLEALAPTLDHTLDELIDHGDPAVLQSLPRLLALLPRDLLAPRVVRLAYGNTAPAELAWDVADLLLRIAPDQPTTPPEEPQALARWAYVQALSGPAGRAALAKAPVALTALTSTPLGDQRLLHVAAALADDHELPVSARIAGLALLHQSRQPTAMTVIDRACYDESHELRQAALEMLTERDPDRARAALSRTALERQAEPQVRIGAIERLAALQGEESLPLLARAAADTTLPLYARLLSITALGESTQSSDVLLSLLRDSENDVLMRAAAARALGRQRHTTALPMMLSLLNNRSTPSALAAGVCEGLGDLGNTTATTQLIDLLERCPSEIDLTLVIIAALGKLGGADAIDQLSALIGDEALARLQRTVRGASAQDLAGASLDSYELGPALAQRLDEIRHSAETQADAPSTIGEFLAYEADRLRSAAAQALGRIGGNSARAALLAALLDNTADGGTAAVIDALAEEKDPEGPAALGYLLLNPDADPMVRWMAVQRLQQHPSGELVLLRSFKQNTLDPFTRGALAEALGQRHIIDALPLLRHIADDASSDTHLRAQVIIALGTLDDPATESTLLGLINDANVDTELRGLAAEHMPSRMTDEARRQLRDLLRRDRPPAPIAAGALRALGRAQDRESLTLMLRYSQDEPPTVAHAALLALRDMGDDGVAPVLVRVAQNPATDQAIRLLAVGTLLRIGGPSYQPLLRPYLNYGTLPMRMQALEHLLDSGAPLDELLSLLANRSWPLPLRLRLLHHCAALPGAAPALRVLLADDSEEHQLRMASIRVLLQSSDSGVLPVLIELARTPTTDLSIRLRSIAGIGLLSEPGDEGAPTLDLLVEAADQPSAVRAGALQALHTAIQQRMACRSKS
ncbi:MAG TPA: HEAT repeat domain-containing protein [Roseiflexaceae bacterium]|nr:HEAT repeat domain-containing protein [Roseiflexaceae bacterium]